MIAQLDLVLHGADGARSSSMPIHMGYDDIGLFGQRGEGAVKVVASV